MLFNSYEFVLLVVFTMALYYLPLLRNYQVLILILSSFFFYAYNRPVLLFLLVFSVLFVAWFSYAVYYRYRRRQSLWMGYGVISSLAVLAFFKYSGLIFKTFFSSLPSISGAGKFILTIPLPIGISFFTFEGISLIVDAYRFQKSKDKPFDLQLAPDFKTHLQNTAFFISFFPHLIAGPIIKAHLFFPQIEAKYFKDIDWEYVFKTLVVGYFLKMVIADNLKDQTFWIAFPHFQIKSSLTLIVLLYGYSIQIFSDFAGYSLIAIGIAALFGYKLQINFNYPYIARSFSEFWQRWHISLSTWLKEYLYIPLGGNRKGRVRIYVNLMIVMFLGGLWHGAAWSYAVWGAWHGVMLAIERLLKNTFGTLKENLLLNIFKMLFVFVSVTIAWLLFKLPEFSHVILYFKKVFTNINLKDDDLIIVNVIVYSLPVVGYHLLSLLKNRAEFDNVFNRVNYIIYGILLFLILMNSGSANEFIYFQF